MRETRKYLDTLPSLSFWTLFFLLMSSWERRNQNGYFPDCRQAALGLAQVQPNPVWGKLRRVWNEEVRLACLRDCQALPLR